EPPVTGRRTRFQNLPRRRVSRAARRFPAPGAGGTAGPDGGERQRQNHPAPAGCRAGRARRRHGFPQRPARGRPGGQTHCGPPRHPGRLPGFPAVSQRVGGREPAARTAAVRRGLPRPAAPRNAGPGQARKPERPPAPPVVGRGAATGGAGPGPGRRAGPAAHGRTLQQPRPGPAPRPPGGNRRHAGRQRLRGDPGHPRAGRRPFDGRPGGAAPGGAGAAKRLPPRPLPPPRNGLRGPFLRPGQPGAHRRPAAPARRVGGGAAPGNPAFPIGRTNPLPPARTPVALPCRRRPPGRHRAGGQFLRRLRGGHRCPESGLVPAGPRARGPLATGATGLAAAAGICLAPAGSV
ncbi:MAG: hypothetical protein AVDCRST_MAG56-5940, partial [uncultured Cytophagales bacterium]